MSYRPRDPKNVVMMPSWPEGHKRLPPPRSHPFALVDHEGLILVRKYLLNGGSQPCVYPSHIGAMKGQKRFGGTLIMREGGGQNADAPPQDPYEVGPDGGIWPRVEPLRHAYGPEVSPGVCWCGAAKDTPPHQRSGGNDA